MPKHSQADLDLLKAALVGYEVTRQRLVRDIAEIEAKLRDHRPRRTAVLQNGSGPTTVRKHRISEAGRERIAAAQRKRWAAMKATLREPARTVAKQRSGRLVKTS